MSKILKKIFKAGNYGTKGNYSIDTFKKWVEAGKEFSIVPGHIGDWLKNGYVKTSIPLGGKVKCASVDEDGFLYGEIQYNEFGKKVTEGGAYENFSIGISPEGNPDHLALLGYAPPHIKELDKAFSEFAGEVAEIDEYIGFAKTEPEPPADPEPEDEMKPEQVVEYLKGLDVAEDNKKLLEELQDILWEKMDQAFWAEKLKSEGYSVTKEFSEHKSESEIREEVRREIIREGQKETLKTKIKGLVPPAIRGIMEFAVDQAFSEENYENIIEFSEDEKTPMKDHLMKMAEEGGPFRHLFKEFSKGIGSEGPKVKTADDIINNAKKIMMEV
ncbi:hypothetical protein [uncultured Ilyobacter sp.]|uniref:hypothetical protein n=1 Tax=uncultured Ilyobacter sp. TaxID=544433 RepID=UPI0029C9318C|nr:hypothetical protein [uncultured Ilyobacter sp.]